ncbi:hypothetical protein [Ramlibacter sp.]|uniref:hypothetical protein n=1 Tax=Ramlibacter sp. TaxID=1917967 RepID=UPI00262C7126|nr:hypothetical protein [Ramlibacter sp.]MDB5957909.1 hypothetical protein [Ramlibacter sp.]
MPFVNEYVPPVESEPSEFFREARVRLKIGASDRNVWTIDRENDMVLVRQGGGHTIDSHNEDYWSFIDRKGYYYWTTYLLSQREISQDEVAITRSIAFQVGRGLSNPDAATTARIKEALCEYKDYGVASDYKRGLLILIDAVTGKEI